MTHDEICTHLLLTTGVATLHDDALIAWRKARFELAQQLGIKALREWGHRVPDRGTRDYNAYAPLPTVRSYEQWHAQLEAQREDI